MSWTSDDWLTPPEVIRTLGPFDFDPCTPVIRLWDTAKTHYSLTENGLAQTWIGRGWFNPPYSQMPDWIDKWAAGVLQGNTGLGLYNARTETEWFARGVWSLAYGVLFVKGRMQFYRPDGRKSKDPRNSTVIVSYSEDDSKILYGSNIAGKFVALKMTFPVEITTTWRRLIRFILKQAGGICNVDELYELVADHPKAVNNPNWKAKVRQIVQLEGCRIGPSLWELKTA